MLIKPKAIKPCRLFAKTSQCRKSVLTYFCTIYIYAKYCLRIKYIPQRWFSSRNIFTQMISQITENTSSNWPRCINTIYVSAAHLVSYPSVRSLHTWSFLKSVISYSVPTFGGMIWNGTCEMNQKDRHFFSFLFFSPHFLTWQLLFVFVLAGLQWNWEMQ